jgi:hypothetical protein
MTAVLAKKIRSELYERNSEEVFIQQPYPALAILTVWRSDMMSPVRQRHLFQGLMHPVTRPGRLYHLLDLPSLIAAMHSSRLLLSAVHPTLPSLPRSPTQLSIRMIFIGSPVAFSAQWIHGLISIRCNKTR